MNQASGYKYVFPCIWWSDC